MDKPKIYITRKLPKEIINNLEEYFIISMWQEEDVPVPRDVLLENVKDIDGLFCLLTEDINKELLDKAPNLKIISNMAVGYNNVDVEEAKKRNIIVTNTPGVLTETTADLTFTLLMTAARRIVEASSYLNEGNWKTWSPMQLTGQDIHGATLGIIGLGRIGEALVKRAKGFDMNIIYNNREPKPEKERELGIQYRDLNSLLKESDFVCILIPYSPNVYHLIGEKELSMMKSTAVLVNTARGGIVNESALYNALKNGVIWGAGLDVFEKEPVSLDHPLLTLKNVVTLPHIGSASINTRLKMAELASNNLIKVLSGEEPITPVS
ncbi:2-hydroxyacid dehydrogenase [Salipaludibacillus sp. CF4.18]|uniref:2-hydroxyacid dehydrogenase n=1 Tax=Salipaludibacillus sp. CF4.18 TaxID=3373081 RepID=UPI003EE4A2EE